MTFLARAVLGSGRLPEQMRAELRDEGVVYLVEGLTGSERYRGCHAPVVRRSAPSTPRRAPSR